MGLLVDPTPGGQLHIVGATPSATVNLFALLAGDKTIAGWPIGSPGVIMKMLQSSTRNGIKAVTEDFPV